MTMIWDKSYYAIIKEANEAHLIRDKWNDLIKALREFFNILTYIPKWYKRKLKDMLGKRKRIKEITEIHANYDWEMINQCAEFCEDRFYGVYPFSQLVADATIKNPKSQYWVDICELVNCLTPEEYTWLILGEIDNSILNF